MLEADQVSWEEPAEISEECSQKVHSEFLRLRKRLLRSKSEQKRLRSDNVKLLGLLEAKEAEIEKLKEKEKTLHKLEARLSGALQVISSEAQAF